MCLTLLRIFFFVKKRTREREREGGGGWREIGGEGGEVGVVSTWPEWI